MKTPPLALESGSYLIGYMRGDYIPPSRKTTTPAFLGFYLNKELEDSPYSFCYFNLEGGFVGHSSHFERDETVDRALMEAWYDYLIWPHYWQFAPKEEVEAQIADAHLRSEYVKRFARFQQIVEEFQLREMGRALAYGNDDHKYENDRLFYPQKPNRPDVPRMT